MITPRRTCLYRAPDLATFRTILIDIIVNLTVADAGDTLVLVPTRAAAEQLRRTVEDRALSPERRAMSWPIVATRSELYDEFWKRLPTPPVMLSPFEREVTMSAVARKISAAGLTLPFRVRPSLVAEMLALYDHIRRLGRSVDDFERNFRDELEREQDIDRGAARLLQQTLFLAATFRGYEQHVADDERCDEHALRRLVLKQSSRCALRRVIITVADRIADPDGLWPADFDLLTRAPGLQQLTVISTEPVLTAGYLERLHAALPELDEAAPVALHARRPPILITPPLADTEAGESLCFSSRDREEELAAVARRVKFEHRTGSAAPLNRTALIVRRPLPYLYLARDVFADAAIPFETLDTLPLAAEPYAAALDLALDAVAADFTRASLLALLRSPHFQFRGEDGQLDSSDVAIAASDFALADARYLGGLGRLQDLEAAWSEIRVPASRQERRRQVALPAIRAVLAGVKALQPLADDRPAVDQITTLVDWLHRFDRQPAEQDPTRARRQRVRAAVLETLAALRRAYERHDPDAHLEIGGLTAAIRRWLGSQTFATFSGRAGLQIVDAQAVRYGDFDDLQIVGLVDGEWPERVRRNVLYPSSLLRLLEPLPATADPQRPERDALQAARAGFKDLVMSAASRVRLSGFLLENDAVVEPSMLIDEVAGFSLQRVPSQPPSVRVSYAEALAIEPRRPEIVPAVSANWAQTRLAVDDRPSDRFKGAAGPWWLPRVSVSRLERYLDCPFRFFASEVLRLEEQPEDEDMRTPLERGRFLHELWERFFSEWQRRGHGRVDSERLPEARALFEELCEEALAGLSPSEAALERSRLLGSPLRPGIAHRVFAMEASRPERIDERLLEYPLQGDFIFQTKSGVKRAVTLSAQTDRVDVLADGTLRVIDYKSKKTPDLKQALQLPIYSYVSRESLAASRGGRWTVAEALYLSFEGDRAVVPLRVRGRTIDELLDDAQDRLLTTLDRIAEGQFPASPARKGLCVPCPYRAVCRLEIVDAVGEPNGD